MTAQSKGLQNVDGNKPSALENISLKPPQGLSFKTPENIAKGHYTCPQCNGTVSASSVKNSIATCQNCSKSFPVGIQGKAVEYGKVEPDNKNKNIPNPNKNIPMP